jgi:hypothetical protein
LQASAGDDVGRTSVLCHVQRVLIPHIDDRRANLNPFGLRADGSHQREGRAELAGEVMHAKVSPVRAQILGGNGQVDRLHERVGS